MVFEELRDKTLRAAKRAAVRLEEASKREPGLGNGYVFPHFMTPEIALEWVVVVQHKDDSELWYVVACDQHGLVGTTDIELPSVDGAPWILRCSHGFWVHRSDLVAPAWCVGFHDGAAEKFADVKNNRVKISVEQESTDIAYDYEIYMEDVRACSLLLEQFIQGNRR
tara:strand:+ start:477 stop:977 length:501 start_codon:yes stop_codon:yes gene_type:complete